MTKKGTCLTTGAASIYELTKEGHGKGDFEDADVCIPFALPGEQVEFNCQTFKKRKKYFLNTIVKASAERVQPLCKHFTQCGGCMLQHMNQKLYSEFKAKLITDALLANGLDPFIFDGLTVLPFGQRRRANMDVVKKNDTLFMGFHRYQSYQIINIEECFTLDPVIVDVLPAFRTALNHILKPFEKAKVFFTLTAVGLDVSLEIQGLAVLDESQKIQLTDFAKKSELTRFTFRYRKTSDVLWLKEDPVVLFDDIPVEVDAYSFLQASNAADEFLHHFVTAHVPQAGRILDLFCGRGTLTIPLSKQAHVVGYEFDKRALEALQKAALHANRPIETHMRDLFETPLSTHEIEGFDTIVIDPPRAGALEQCKILAKTKAVKILYVSCNPETFARDAHILTQGSYTLDLVHGLDQFAWSPHVEVLGVFSQKT